MLRNQNLVGIIVFRCNHQTLLALGFLTEGDHTTDFSQDGRLFRATGLEQVGNPRQTTGNIPGLGAFLRNTRYNVTQLDRKSTRLNSSHVRISYAVFCLKKKKKKNEKPHNNRREQR